MHLFCPCCFDHQLPVLRAQVRLRLRPRQGDHNSSARVLLRSVMAA